MELVIIKVGNSAGVTFPAPLLRDLGLKVGQGLTVSKAENGGVLLVPKKRYTLKELLSQCDPKAPEPADLKLWNEAKPVGREVL
jgi:antitoxin ChpS